MVVWWRFVRVNYWCEEEWLGWVVREGEKGGGLVGEEGGRETQVVVKQAKQSNK